MEQSRDVPVENNTSAAATTDDVEQFLNAFDRHLESERGCAPGTRAHYLGEARCFLVDVFPDLKTDWEALKADHVAFAPRRKALQIEPTRPGHSDPKFIALPHI